MKNPSQTGEEFQSTTKSLPPSVVRQLSKVDPVQSTLSVLWNMGLIILFITVALLWWNPLVIVLAIIGLAAEPDCRMTGSADICPVTGAGGHFSGFGSSSLTF